MSSASVTNNFVNGAIGDADQVDQNFSDLVTFCNNHLVHRGETALEAKSGAPGLKMQSGADSISVTTSGNTWSKAVTFPVAFSTVPIIFLSNGIGGGGAKKYTLAYDDPATTTGFTAYASSTDLNPPSGAISVPFKWLAIGT